MAHRQRNHSETERKKKFTDPNFEIMQDGSEIRIEKW